MELYKKLLNEANKFTQYNFRNYFTRKVKDEFKWLSQKDDVEADKEALAKAHEMYDMLKRQATIDNMYASEKLVIENKSKK